MRKITAIAFQMCACLIGGYLLTVALYVCTYAFYAYQIRSQ